MKWMKRWQHLIVSNFLIAMSLGGVVYSSWTHRPLVTTWWIAITIVFIGISIGWGFIYGIRDESEWHQHLETLIQKEHGIYKE